MSEQQSTIQPPWIVVINYPGLEIQYINEHYQAVDNIRDAWRTFNLKDAKAHLTIAKRCLANCRNRMEIRQMELRDAQTPTMPVVGIDGFVRTALLLGSNTGSIDVLTPDGKTLCRLNISLYNQTGKSGGCVDVIKMDYPNMRACSLLNGRMVLNETIEGHLLAADIRDPYAETP